MNGSISFALFLIFGGAALMSTLALFTRQSMLVGYIVLGGILGPYGLNILPSSEVGDQASDIGIIFLLFLMGLHLYPQKLLQMFSKTIWVALISSVLFAGVGYLIARLFGFSSMDGAIIGAAMMFSSTIIGLKLLPTTALHHQHTGELVISLLLLQDLIAIVTLLFLQGASAHKLSLWSLIMIVIALPILLLVAFLAQKYVVLKLLKKFNRIHEYIFLLSIGWCLGMVQLSQFLGLSAGIGAFIAGVALAAHPISQYIAESLKPLRDFFLVLFFFSIGAHFDAHDIPQIILPALVLAVVMLGLKPWVFKYLLCRSGETPSVAWEVGWRLGQMSEFSLLIAYFIARTQMVSTLTSSLIQAATILSFIASSYVVVLRYPSPLAFSEKLRRD